MGFDPNFIPEGEVPLPTLGLAAKAVALNGGQVIEHSRFSLVFNEERGFALYTAHNIDGAALIPDGTIDRVNDFREDPLVDSNLQIGDRRGYKDNRWDKGHLVRRTSMHWGDLEAAKQGDSESFYWTNIAPQHQKLHRGAWGKIEKWMVEMTERNNQRVCIFTGPVFTSDDPVHQNHPDEEPIRVPAAFWKILAIWHNRQLKAAGFLVWQRDYDKELPVTFDPQLEQIRITTLEHIVGMSFGPLRDADPLRFGQDVQRTRGVNKGGYFVTNPRQIVL